MANNSWQIPKLLPFAMQLPFFMYPSLQEPGRPAAQIFLISSRFLWDFTSTPIGGSDNKESSHNEGDPSSIPGGKNLLEKRMATLSGILAWRTHGQKNLVGLQRVRHWATKTLTFSETSRLPGFYYYFDSSKCFQTESQWGHSEEFSTVAQSCPILLQAHELQHTRLPCPSPTPRAYSNSCPSSRWCHPSISSSAIRFSFHLQSFPASRYFQWVTSLHQVTKELEFQLQHQSPMKFRTDFI